MNNYSRRTFLSAGAMALSGAAIATTLPSWMKDLANDPVRIGVIGCGTRGVGIARLMKKITELKLVAYCDNYTPHMDAMAALATPNARKYADYRKLLEDKDIDAVVIATPLYLHYPMAVDALAAGKHVYLEKSMTHTLPQALKLEKIVKEQNKVFQVGHQYRYFPLYHRAKEIIDQKWLGEVTQIECQYHRNASWRFPVPEPGLEKQINWRMYKAYSGGLVAELCAHQIDMVNYILDSHPAKIVGMGGIDYWKDGRDTWDNVRTLFSYDNGVKASFSSILSNAFRGYSIRILGTKATLEIQRDDALLYAEGAKKETGIVDGVTGATVTNWSQGNGVPLTFDMKGFKEPTTVALIDFAECIRTGKTPASNARTGKLSAVAVHLANQAIESGNTQFWKKEYGS